MRAILETPRLLLGEITTNDRDQLFSLLSDSSILYAFDRELTADEKEEWLQRQLRCYEAVGFGLWALSLKETGEWIGQAGFSLQTIGDGESVLELNYLLKHHFWHAGYATEAAAACRDYALHTLSAPALCAILQAEDIASRKVAKAIGMRRKKELTFSRFGKKSLCMLYEITR